MGDVRDLYASKEETEMPIPPLMQMKIFSLKQYNTILEWETDLNAYIKDLQVRGIPNQVTCVPNQVFVLYAAMERGS